MRPFQSLYDRVLVWSGHRHARGFLMGLSFAEATFFPIPPDVMLAPMVLARREQAWQLAFLTTISSVIGGVFGYLIGWLSLDLVFPLIEQIGYEDEYQRAVDAFANYGIWFVIIAGFTPIPFKIITISAGALSMSLPLFILASLIGRGARFYLVAGLIWSGGKSAAAHLRAWVDTIGWLVVAALLVAVLLYALVPGL
ncbi:MAG: DedA family protein [Xanthomonadaceae bacterium]|nr:DedA family protein [Xanthomonadaceae bacterium]